MTSPSTIPSHAISIWAEGESIRVALGAHVITLPKLGRKVQVRGNWYGALEFALTKLLQEREVHQAPLIGELGAPTQAQVPSLSEAVVKAWLAEDRKTRAEAKAKADVEAITNADALAAAARAEKSARASKFLAEIGL
jgi:hypothetical protein